MFSYQSAWFAVGTIAGACLVGPASAATISMTQLDARKDFRQSHPRALFMERDARLYKISDMAIAAGVSAPAAAEAAKAKVSPLLGVPAEDFIAVGPFPNGQHTADLMYRPETDDYKFTGFYWTQTAAGLPVWRTRLMALVRNDAGYPVVQVTSDVRDVRGFTAPQTHEANPGMALRAAVNVLGRDAHIGEIEVVVFAGVDDMVFTPRVAMVFEATIGSTFHPDVYDKRLLVVDLQNGSVLHDENRILNAVSGTAEAMNSQGSGADECEAEVWIPIPYARITGGGQTVNTDSKGYFELPTNGNITIGSTLDGLYFDVNESSGDDSTSTSASNGDYVSIGHHEQNNNEQYRAQINAYIGSNTVRDFILQHDPTFPVIFNQFGFPVNTGVSGTCNAFYDYESINFYNAGGGCNNTSFSVIVFHEFGHHAVACGGSGQDSYGEGMGDVLGVLLTGDNQLARGFFQGDCTNGLRNADNDYQYPCSGGIHDCGQLISACVWDALITVDAANPGEGHDIVSRLAINSIKMHSGGDIDPTITMDWLVLDDDDGDIANGTPHSEELLQAFAMHNMDALPEPVDNDFCSTAREITWGTWDVNTIGALSDGDAYNEDQCGGTYLGSMSSDIWYRLSACGTGTMSVSTCDLVGFDSDLVIYEGSDCGSLAQVGCNGDGSNCGNYSSYAEISVTEGTTYYIRLGGWNSSAMGTGLMIVDGPGDPCDEGCTGDFDGSGSIDANDILHLISEWGGSGGDANGDGTTDTKDLLLLIGGWGECD